MKAHIGVDAGTGYIHGGDRDRGGSIRWIRTSRTKLVRADDQVVYADPPADRGGERWLNITADAHLVDRAVPGRGAE